MALPGWPLRPSRVTGGTTDLLTCKGHRIDLRLSYLRDGSAMVQTFGLPTPGVRPSMVGPSGFLPLTLGLPYSWGWAFIPAPYRP